MRDARQLGNQLAWWTSIGGPSDRLEQIATAAHSTLCYGLAVERAALRFETIDLTRDAEVAVALRRDSYVCSFGSDEAFGKVDEYLSWLRQRIASHPAGHVHVWDGSKIVGQIEMLIRKTSPLQCYVSLFYLTPPARGVGHGRALHQYFADFTLARGAQLAQLSVSPSNARALAYYHKHGWQDAGPNPVDPNVRLMVLRLA